MGLSISTDGKPVKVIVKEKTYDGGSFKTYSIMVSSKDRDDEWKNGFIDAVFPKGTDLQNKAKITIKKAFPVVSEYKGKTYVKIYVQEFEVAEDGESPANTDWQNMTDEDLPFGPITR